MNTVMGDVFNVLLELEIIHETRNMLKILASNSVDVGFGPSVSLETPCLAWLRACFFVFVFCFHSVK